MSKFPTELDTDVELPLVTNNIVEIGAEAINALRDATFNIEENIGIDAQGSKNSIAERLETFLEPDGTPKTSVLVSLGLIALPIRDNQIAADAAIQESKITLTYSTQTLYDLITALDSAITVVNGFISTVGIKVNPHIAGTDYRHKLSHIDIDTGTAYLNKNGLSRTTTNLNTLLSDINTDLVTHEKNDGTSTGTVPSTNFAHVAAGIEANTSNFTTIPQIYDNVQDILEYLDNSNLFTVGNRFQNLFSNGIPRTSRLSTLTSDGYGQNLVPVTPVTSYLLAGGVTSPKDDIFNGDDVIEFFPADNSTNIFDSQFCTVKPGDILTINYGSTTVQFIIDNIKQITSPTISKRYLVRINGKNLLATTAGIARIDRALYNENKYGVLNTSVVNNSFNSYPSVIAANPRGAVALGIGFDPTKIDSTHYNLYLQLFPDGNPSNKTINLPAIDISGNAGATPGKYSLESIVEETNKKIHTAGFNLRFVAFSYNGEFGMMLADHYQNASFAIMSGIINSAGTYDSGLTASTYPNNVVDPITSQDALGFGDNGANLASPPYALSFSTTEKALVPTKIFVPLSRNYFYVNGVERDKLNFHTSQVLDTYGDGYWPATITARTLTSSTVETTYQVSALLDNAKLASGKTLVVLPNVAVTDSSYNPVDYGRFIIKTVVFDPCCSPGTPTTTITVYDAVHGAGASPYASSASGTVRLYFNDDSIGVDNQNITDGYVATNFKRYHEFYVDQDGATFSHEKLRFYTISGGTSTPVQLYCDNSEIPKINIVSGSSKLKGYKFANNFSKITLHISNYSDTTGLYDGYLCRYDGSVYSNSGPITSGRKGDVVRFYDETTVDFIDFKFNIDDLIASFTNKNLDIQVFKPIDTEGQQMRIGSGQLNDFTKEFKFSQDKRTFGNTSEKNLTTSALDFINAGEKYLHQNSVMRGFDYVSISSNKISLTGGLAVVDGKFISANNNYVDIPIVRELYSSVEYANIIWAICINNKSELQVIPLRNTDSSLTVPTVESRIFTVLNPKNSQTYYLESTTFSELVNLRKDLTLLHLAISNVTGTGLSTAITVTTRDVRKFGNDLDTQVSQSLTDSLAGGGFKNFTTVNNWLKYNQNYNNIILVRGTHSISSALNLSYANREVLFEGDGYTQINVDTNLTIGSNIRFKNIKFNLNGNLFFVIQDSDTVSFENCVFEAASVTQTGIALDNANNISFKNCKFIYKYITNPSSNLISSGAGLIYSNVTASRLLSNFNVRDCSFTYTPSTDGYQRNPFINIELSEVSAFVKNVDISNNQFINSATSGGLIIDLKSAVAVVNTTTPSVTTYNNRPALINFKVKDNWCDARQIIALTSVTSSSQEKSPGLNCIDTEISGNKCGAIAYFVSRGVGSLGLVYGHDEMNSSLTIKHNSCHYIYNCDSTGQLFLADTNSEYAQGNILIEGNHCNWIHISASGGILESIKVSKNFLNAYDTTVLANYGGTADYGIYIYANLNSSKGSNSNVIVSENSLEYNTIKTSAGGVTTYTYGVGGILFLSSGQVINNKITGLISNSSTTHGIRFGGVYTLINGNSIYRQSSNIFAYIRFSHPDGTTTSPQGTIVNNLFDQYTTDGSNEQVCANIPANFTYEKNINQTKVKLLQFLEEETKFNAAETSTETAPISTGSGYSAYKLDGGGTALNTTTSATWLGDTADTARSIKGYWNLTSLLPANVKIIDGYLGFYASSSTDGNYDLPENKFTIRIARGYPGVGSSGNPYAVPPTGDSILNIKGILNSYGTATVVSDTSTVTASSPMSNFTSATNYVFIAPVSNTYYTDNEAPIMLNVTVQVKGTSALWVMSPVRIKYRW